MTAKYFAILTNQGAARLANAAALGTKLNLTQMAVGDANGSLPTPEPAQTKLINQKRIAPLNLLTVDPANTSQIIAEQIIPENEGGFWIREIGLYDDDGILIAVANCPETYKPQLQEGSGRTQTIRMILIVSSTSAITLKIDPAVVLATRQYVDDKVIEVKGYADDLMKKHVEAANPHKQYPLIANALKEMVDAGLVGDVLKNLGLGEGAKLNAATATLGRTGFIAIPVMIGGIEQSVIIQWGWNAAKASASGGDGNTVVFPVAFNNACVAVVANYDNVSAPINAVATGGYTTTSFLLRCAAQTGSYYYNWIAIGY
ncbi:TPA: phage tail protein [Escherichia coli]|nr:phage tail protein [Escherichia coli]